MTTPQSPTAPNHRRRRIARRLFTIGSITFIVIGGFHTQVHLADMSSADLKAEFDQIAPLRGTDVWHLWNGLSLLMGFFAMAIGAANLAGLRARGPEAWPAIGVCLVNAAALVAVGTIGVLHLGPLQTVGGPIGVLLFGLPALWAVTERRHGHHGATREHGVVPETTPGTDSQHLATYVAV